MNPDVLAEGQRLRTEEPDSLSTSVWYIDHGADLLDAYLAVCADLDAANADAAALAERLAKVPLMAVQADRDALAAHRARIGDNHDQ